MNGSGTFALEKYFIGCFIAAGVKNQGATKKVFHIVRLKNLSDYGQDLKTLHLHLELPMQPTLSTVFVFICLSRRR